MQISRKHIPKLLGVLLGLAYGVAARYGFAALDAIDIAMTMTLGYIFLVPLALGVVTLWLEPRPGWLARIVLPWVPGALLIGVAILLSWESSLCIVMGLPVFILMASIGGIIGGLFGPAKQHNNTYSMGALLLLPLLLSTLETQLPLPQSTRTVETRITIDADVATVWENIVRVPAISAHELDFRFSHLMGIPRPVEATLSYPGIGGVRHASFEGGVVFIEEIYGWEEFKSLAFTIVADDSQVWAEDLNAQVVVGGAFFDVMMGEYVIEPRTDGAVTLHLRSRHRLSTTFNPYAGLWTDFVMRDTQQSILEVIKQRAEQEELYAGGGG